MKRIREELRLKIKAHQQSEKKYQEQQKLVELYANDKKQQLLNKIKNIQNKAKQITKEKEKIKKYDRWIDNTKLKMSLYSHKFHELEKTLGNNDSKIEEIYSEFINVFLIRRDVFDSLID